MMGFQQLHKCRPTFFDFSMMTLGKGYHGMMMVPSDCCSYAPSPTTAPSSRALHCQSPTPPALHARPRTPPPAVNSHPQQRISAHTVSDMLSLITRPPALQRQVAGDVSVCTHVPVCGGGRPLHAPVCGVAAHTYVVGADDDGFYRGRGVHVDGSAGFYTAVRGGHDGVSVDECKYALGGVPGDTRTGVACGFMHESARVRSDCVCKDRSPPSHQISPHDASSSSPTWRMAGAWQCVPPCDPCDPCSWCVGCGAPLPDGAIGDFEDIVDEDKCVWDDETYPEQ